MNRELDIGSAVPDFGLVDTYGQMVQLSDYRDHKHVVLVFNRGFM